MRLADLLIDVVGLRGHCRASHGQARSVSETRLQAAVDAICASRIGGIFGAMAISSQERPTKSRRPARMRRWVVPPHRKLRRHGACAPQCGAQAPRRVNQTAHAIERREGMGYRRQRCLLRKPAWWRSLVSKTEIANMVAFALLSRLCLLPVKPSNERELFPPMLWNVDSAASTGINPRRVSLAESIKYGARSFKALLREEIGSDNNCWRPKATKSS
jgi:hypothetical protein